MAEGKSKSRQAAKAETREALIRAGMAAFSEQGIDLPSLDAICARAGFTRGAFYVHFRDREDFLLAVVDRVIGDFVSSVVATSDSADDLGETITRFRQAVATGRFPLLGQGPLLMGLMARGVQGTSPLGDRLRVVLGGVHAKLAAAAERGQRCHRIGSTEPPDAIASLLLAAALGMGNLLEFGIEVDQVRLEESLFALLQIKRG